ncbi:NAD-dependent succinate-semialdehyde dehydrogenase [Aureitalea sp. L0-47]|uniref:NAD-dependent succinate-semialdehyde dehydrogenase n=1 Tax=Aureitalea sp. L0-47 TaxID=2816962 RepID=UPI0022370CC7|nr:NAD-dependent succinate-semialdehyde dehydrogenase [Aureitalea sp. L0-47]MCW5519480.1 NAD-dependent succinate-semialdehyde dehydrogenase [Aureitalea sp. L0-47]
MKEVQSINPYNNKVVDTYTLHSSEQLNALLERAHRRYLKWRKTHFSERSELMKKAAHILRKDAKLYASNISDEMGKPISQAIAEVEKCAWVCDYYAENAESQLSNETIESDADISYVRHEPLGVILAVMPWNYPFWQVFRFAAPTLMAGNVAVLKHASNVFGSALKIEEVFRRAGFPDHSFTTLLVGSNQVESIIDNPVVKAVTLTGSGPAGSAVAQTAGKNIKKSVLELGGNNALIVLEDCDMENTLETCIQARFQNTGQSCIAGKRLLVQESISEEFIQKLVKRVEELKSGDPLDPETYIGTLARKDLAKELESQVKDTIAAGAKLETGGRREEAWYAPTVVSGVTPDMVMFKEETFGPALSVTTFKTVEEAIELSNESKFGLGVSVFTTDISKAMEMIPEFEEGAVFINELVKSDPRLPFGGVKESGYGRELSSHGIKEFVNTKTVYIKR